ncbi:hypothetical protein H0I76_17300 [Limibaculum sp. M0105]|uniref:Uncharacterized protein n=1 Tax=Thermohalobaculum xanthum TaxID=2753746 RepID=A0A8J7MA16_9RHOB|nr:hypothetical protein [Thermohalobaculum xanthum]MBK0400958.1 hypothetical protein [Thermohalobaculum xanthum]
MRSARKTAALALATIGLMTGGIGSAAAEPVTFDAVSMWEANGTVVQSASDRNVFAGEVSGPYAIDTGKGPVPAGRIICVGTVAAAISTGEQVGKGECQIVAMDGAIAFGRFECSGLRLVGCSGIFEITGGEGRLEGAKGSGKIVVRRAETSFKVQNGSLREEAFGVAFWKDMTLEMPEKN